MKVIFSNDLTVYKATVYLKLRKQVERRDLQEYINGKRDYKNPLIKERIEAYLKDIKVYDTQRRLTYIGEILQKEGTIPQYEEGKYQIWYTQQDDLLRSKILYFLNSTNKCNFFRR